MSRTAELSRVKGSIKALTEKTVANGCAEAEAMAAAEMVGRLLEGYALNMDEIEIRTARCVQVEVPLGGRRILLVPPFLRLAVAQPQRRSVRIGWVVLDVWDDHRILSAGRHEDFHRFMRVTSHAPATLRRPRRPR